MVRELLLHEEEGVNQVVELGDEAIPGLIALLLQEKDGWLRHRAAIALGRIGLTAESFKAVATAVRRDPDPVVRLSAAEALGHPHDPQVREGAPPVLAQALADQDAGVRFAALHSVERLEAVGALQAVQHVARLDPVPQVRELARRIEFFLFCH
jgi:HEAT repeat protein